jgi:putative heme transporter
MKRLSLRGWLTVITTVLLVVVVFFAWPEIVRAWRLLDSINLWILALLIPVQLFSYYATGAMIFSYLRAKGNLKDMSRLKMARVALELNFVNHVLPSGGAAGFSYLGWVLSKHGVSVGRSTMAQIIRFALTFVSFLLLLVVAVVALIIDHQIGRGTILICLGLAVLCVAATIGAIWLLGSKTRLDRFASWLTKTANKFITFITRGKKKRVVKANALSAFFTDIHDDYLAIRKDRRILIKPFLWALVANLADVALLWIAFWALGVMINPALLFVAFGVSSLASAVSVTPGGAGVYETIMITFLAASEVPADIAIAGTLIARVTLVLGTILFGYVFYQLSVAKYGKRATDR